MQNDKVSIKYFAKYVRQTKNNTIDLLHRCKDDILLSLGLHETDVLSTGNGAQKKLLILTYYNNKVPAIWVVRYLKGGFAYGGFNTSSPVSVQELSKLFAWVNYNKDGLSSDIEKGYELYGNP